MNDQVKDKLSKDKGLRSHSKEDCSEGLLNESLDQLLVITKAKILTKSKSDAGSSSKRLPREKGGRFLDKNSAAASSSSESYGSPAQSNTLSSEKAHDSELGIATEESNSCFVTANDDLSKSDTFFSPNSMVVGVNNQSFQDNSCDGEPLPTSKQSACKTPSILEEPFGTEVIQTPSLYSSENFAKTVATEILHNAISETTEVENSLLAEMDSQDIAEILTSVAVSQSCLETLQENRDILVKELEKERDKEVAMNKELLARLSEVQELKDRLASLVPSMESSYSDTYKTLTEMHAHQMEANQLEAEKRKNELTNEIKDISARLVVSEAMLAGKEEIESALNERVSNLERELEEKEKHCKEELESLVSETLKNEALMEAKDEVVMEDLLDNSGKRFDGIDRAWLVADLRRAESELSLMGEQDVENSWIESNFQCSFLTLHNEPVEGVQLKKDTLLPSSRFTKISKIPSRTMKVNASFEKLKKDKVDLESRNSHLELQLLQCKEQIERCEKEHLAHVMKNSVLEEELDVVYCKIDDLNTEKKNLLLEINEKNEDLQSAKNKIAALLSDRNVLIGIEIKNNELSDKLARLTIKYDDLALKNDSLNKEVTDLQCALSSTKAENAQFMEELENRKKGDSQLEALEAEIAKLRDIIAKDMSEKSAIVAASETNNAGDAMRESLCLKLKDTRVQLERLQSEVNQSHESFDLPRRFNSTIYMDFFPSPLLDVACQVEEVPATLSVGCQTEHEPLDGQLKSELTQFKSIANKGGNRHSSLEIELETSWTERCEVEEQLACALSENEVLTRRIQQIEDAGRHLMGLMACGVKSTSAWLKLHENVKDIMDDLAILSYSREEWDNLIGGEHGIGGRETVQLHNQPSNVVEPAYRVNAEERLEPEGGVLPPDGDTTFLSNEQPEDLLQTEAALLDQSSNALIDVLQGLLRYVGACDTDANESFGENERSSNITSLLETSVGPDLRGELKRCVAQLKEEVAHIFAISNRAEIPGNAAQLQEEMRSLEHQVASSDKIVKSMRAFVDEQAAEREIERDEFSRRIDELTEKLKQKDRLITNYEQLKADVEHFEQQLQESNNALKRAEENRSDVAAKLSEAMNKIWTMRDIISALEKELASRSEQLELVKQQNSQLEDQLVHLDKLSFEMESANRNSHTDLLSYVGKLEEEVTSLRHRVELTNPESLATVRASLRDLEFVVARSTKDIELVVVTANTLSSASEELSTRELVDATRCQTPDEMRGDIPLGLEEDVDRLRERLLKHARADEVVLKRLREMEHHTRKVDELQVDLEVTQQKLESYLLENATLKAKIEEQRPKAMQKQMLTDLEHRIRQLDKELEAAKVACRNKEQLLIESRKREEQLVEAMSAQQAIFRNDYSEQNAVKNELESERQRAEAATARLQELSELPKVVNVLLAGKNEEIDLLKQQVSIRDLASSCSVDSSSKMQSSASSGKRVKFAVPESFVGSITPIPFETRSVMRDAFESCHEWSFPELSNRQCLPWDGISSIAALQLSPRGTSTEKYLPHSHIEPFSSFAFHGLAEKVSTENLLPTISKEMSKVPDAIVDIESIQQQLLEAQSKIEMLIAEVKMKTDNCNVTKESLRALTLDLSEKEKKMDEMTRVIAENIDNLNKKDSEVMEMKKKLAFHQSDSENIKHKYDEEIARMKSKLNCLNDELNSKVNEITHAKNFTQEALDDARNKYISASNILKEKQTEVDLLNKQIKSLSVELNSAENTLKDSIKENECLHIRIQALLEELKTEREESKEKASLADENLKGMIEKLTKQQEETLILKEALEQAYEELEIVKTQREGIISNWEGKKDTLESLLKVKEEEFDTLQHLLHAKENEILSVKKEIEEKHISTEKLNKEIEMLGMQLARKENDLMSAQKLLAVKNDEIVSVRKDSEEKMSILKARLDKDKELLDTEREKLTFVLAELAKFNEVKQDANLALSARRDEIDSLRERLISEESEKKMLENKIEEQNEIIRGHISELNEKSRLLTVLQNEVIDEREKLGVASEERRFIGAAGDCRRLGDWPQGNAFQASKYAGLESGEVSDLKAQIRLLERIVENLEFRLRNDLERCDKDATIMAHLRANLENSLEQVTALQMELLQSRQHCNDLKERLRRADEQLRQDRESARALRDASLLREEELINQLTVARSQNRKLTLLEKSQSIQISALSKLHGYDIDPPWNGALPRKVRSAGDGAESSQEWRLRVNRLESYRKALVWQKRYLVRSGHLDMIKRVPQKPIGFRAAARAVIAMFRMKFLVRRWRPRLPPLTPSSYGKERRISLTSPPNKDPGLQPGIAQ